MRPIKFRAWDKKKNKWYPLPSWSESEANGDSGNGIMTLISDEFFEWSQFTGLLDKNGKEIYEGDILGYWGGNPNGATWIVGWDENKSGFSANYGDTDITMSGESMSGMPAFKLSKKLCERKEIIGNIYENPELLS